MKMSNAKPYGADAIISVSQASAGLGHAWQECRCAPRRAAISGLSFEELSFGLLAARGKNLPQHVTSIVF
jgi:hypothetical protein